MEDEMENADLEKRSSEQKQVNRRKILALAGGIVLVAALIAAAVTQLFIPYCDASSEFESAAAELEQRNQALDDKISELQELMDSDVLPLDASTLESASDAIGKAQAAKDEIPTKPGGADEIREAAQAIDALGDYSDELALLETARVNLANSIEQRKLVTNPSEQYVIQRMDGVAHVSGVEAATEDNDPNGSLHKDGGYTSAVFFSSDLVNQDQIYPDPETTGIPSLGTDAGGCIEVYETVEDAEARNEYLASFDGGILASGSHVVVGTCVIRTSNLLTASQQEEMESNVIAALTSLDQ